MFVANAAVAFARHRYRRDGKRPRTPQHAPPAPNHALAVVVHFAERGALDDVPWSHDIVNLPKILSRVDEDDHQAGAIGLEVALPDLHGTRSSQLVAPRVVYAVAEGVWARERAVRVLVLEYHHADEEREGDEDEEDEGEIKRRPRLYHRRRPLL